MPSRQQKSPAQAHGASTPVPVSLQGWATLFKTETWSQRFRHPGLSLGLVFKLKIGFHSFQIALLIL